ncbi:MAG: AAA family ATPase [Chlamydiota bacterium]
MLYLIGNEQCSNALARMVNKKCVPNTLLFYGPDGVGKSLFALQLAELLMGEEHGPKIASNNHPDIHIYHPEGKSGLHPIDSMRKLIQEVALPPFEAPVKVFIIHDAHQMLPYSSNALLKTLEEPPLDTYLILLTSALDAILPTICSRCRKIPFFPIPQQQIETFVKEQWETKEDAARRIAFLSHGSLAKAKRLADANPIAYRTPLMEILSLKFPGEYPHFLKLAAALEESLSQESEEGEDEEEGGMNALQQADLLFEEIIAWHRDLHLVKEGGAFEFLYHLDQMDRLKESAARPLEPLERTLERVAECRLALQRHVKLKTVLEHFFLHTA